MYGRHLLIVCRVFSLISCVFLGVTACQPTIAEQITIFGWFVAIRSDGFLAEDGTAKYWLIKDEGWYRLALNTWQIDRLGGMQALNGRWVKIQAEVLARYALRVRKITLEDPPQVPQQITLSGWFAAIWSGETLGSGEEQFVLINDQGWYQVLLNKGLTESAGGLQALNGKWVKTVANSLVTRVLWVQVIELEKPPPFEQVRLSGWFHEMHGDTMGSGRPPKVEYWLIDDQGRWYRLLFDVRLTKPFGGPAALDNRRVKIIADVWGARVLWVSNIILEETAALNSK